MELLIDILGDSVTSAEIEMIRNSLFLILALPLVATLTGFFRHVIGLKSLNVYAPIILTFGFYQLGYIDAEQDNSYMRGLLFGLILYAIVFVVSTNMYLALKRLRMHYVPKSSLVMITVSVAIVLTIILGTLLFERKGLIYLDIFSILMIATLSDTFVSSLSRKSLKYTTIIGLQTLFTGVVAYSIISIDQVKTLVLDYAFILIIALLLINLYIGRFVGLRLTEYYRFRDLLTEEINGKPSTKNRKK